MSREHHGQSPTVPRYLLRFTRGHLMKNLSGKTVVITGAGSGIGRALAHQLASEGALLALADLNEAGLAETYETLPIRPVQVNTYIVDVSDQKAVYDLAEQVTADFGGVDVVINNAGVALSQTIEDMTLEDLRWVMDINFWGVVYGTKAFLPILKTRSQACIINISSVFGLIAVPTQGAYNASKFAVRGFTEALRQELAGTSVKALCVHPGGIKTSIARNARFYRAPGGDSERDIMVSDFDKLAHTTAADAAATIVKALKQGRERVLIGPDAHAIDWVQRLLPSGYTRVLGALIKRAGKMSRRKTGLRQG